MGCGIVVPQKDLDRNSASVDVEDFRALLDGDLSGEEKLIKMCNENPEKFKALLKSSFGKDSKTRSLDNNTRCFRELVNKVKSANEKATKKVSAICIPQEKKKLEFYTLEGIQGMGVPLDDEDWPDRSAMQKAIMGMTQSSLIGLLKSMPCEDEISFFDSVEEGIIVGDLTMKDVLPLCTEKFEDLISDDAMSMIAFWGIGQVFLAGKPDGGFECDLTLLDSFAVRPKFERYGARAVFDKAGNIESIFWSHGNCVVKPGEGKKWEHAKWAWKASLGAAVTAVTHLVQLHWIVVNATHVACRQELGANHPVRRALKIFLYNTGGVNFGSTMSLYPKDSFLHRMSALEYDGLVAAINAGDASFKYQTHPEFVKSKNLGPEMEAKIPICVDGIKVWDAYHKFFDGYVRLYYADDKAVTDDKELNAYWACIENRCGLGSPYKYGLPPLSLAALVDQITHHAFQATCWHEFVGAIVHYLTTPEGLATKIIPDVEVMDCQTFFQGLCLIGLTGTKQPAIMSDWTHLFLDDKKKETVALHAQLIKDFEDLSEWIEKENAKAPCPSRRRKVESFNPKHFECSVSV